MSALDNSTWLITGAQGCIGSWVVKNLVEAGRRVVVFDLDTQPRRLVQVLPPERLAEIVFVAGDICDTAAVARSFDNHNVGHVIHLAALQVPACQANPIRGAQVNVIGTLNVFEAAARSASVPLIVYASSAAVAGPPEDYSEAFTEASALHPGNHYGVFKQCNEGNARIYFQTRAVSSIGLRPWAVYGVGRDFGLTSDPTKAIKAAVVGRPFQIKFGGMVDMQYVDDVAKIFIRAADSALTGARIYNLRGSVVSVEQIVAAVVAAVPSSAGLIGYRGSQLPIVPAFDDAALRRDLAGATPANAPLPATSLTQGVAETVRLFQKLLAENRLPVDELEPPSTAASRLSAT
jgi:nucleoside-diphosphate-sugar epimerase